MAPGTSDVSVTCYNARVCGSIPKQWLCLLSYKRQRTGEFVKDAELGIVVMKQEIETGEVALGTETSVLVLGCKQRVFGDSFIFLLSHSSQEEAHRPLEVRPTGLTGSRSLLPMPQGRQCILTPDSGPQQQPISGTHSYSKAAVVTSEPIIIQLL